MSKKQIKTIKKITIAIMAIFLSVIKVEGASCTYVEKAKLNETASKVKTNYEVIEEEIEQEYIDPDTGEKGTYKSIKTSFKISIYNLTEDLYVLENNSLTKEEKYIFYENTVNGIYSFVSEDIENIIKYDYKIYSNLENCTGDILKSYSFTKPKVNLYSQYRMCEGLEEVPYCRIYLTEDIKMSEAELEEALVKYISKKENKEKENKEKGITEVIKENYIYIITGVVLVVGTAVVTIIIVKKRSAI